MLVRGEEITRVIGGEHLYQQDIPMMKEKTGWRENGRTGFYFRI